MKSESKKILSDNPLWHRMRIKRVTRKHIAVGGRG